MNTIKELRNKSIKELRQEFNELHREFFNLNLQKALSQPVQTHHLKNVKQKWAQIKTILTEKMGNTV
jgi:large subunit ribosomal protein L29